MLNLSSASKKRIYCLGIGGIGVSALAEFLHHQGHEVVGSDRHASKVTDRLRALGLQVWTEHKVDNLRDIDWLVYTSAVSADHVLLQHAAQQGIPRVKRGELLAAIMHDYYYSIAVAGTHGKTTTSSLLAYLLDHAGLQPNYFVGGVMQHAAAPVCVTGSQYMVAEADESDGSFLAMRPRMAVVTNINPDHLESYQGNFGCLQQAFIDFLAAIPSDGLAVLCVDHPELKKLAPQVAAPVVTYGFSEDAQVRASEYQPCGLQSLFRLHTSQGEYSVTLNLAGKHNVLNALACVAVAMHLQCDIEPCLVALSTFPGVARRLQCHAHLGDPHHPISVFEDYGHHPVEIDATLKALRAAWPDRRLVMVFQPHRYGRTQRFLQQFATVLAEVDGLLLLPIYAAGEPAIEGVTSEVLAQAVASRSRVQPRVVDDESSLFCLLQGQVLPGDLVLFQGAGSVGLQARAWVEELS